MKSWLLIVFLLLGVAAFGNDSTRLYNPYADVAKDMQVIVSKAKAENKHILIQVGGNWCVWCYKLNSFIKLDSTLKRITESNYIVYHLNYSPENKNAAYLKKLGNPQRYGFPVLVVLDADGKQLITQPTPPLTKGYGYDTDKVKVFLLSYAPPQPH